MIFDDFRMISWCTLGVISEHNFLHGYCWVAPKINFSNKLLSVFFVFLLIICVSQYLALFTLKGRPGDAQGLVFGKFWKPATGRSGTNLCYPYW